MKILFATDGSEYASEAAQILTELQTESKIDLTILTATYAPENLLSGTVQPWYAEWREAESKRIHAHYEQLSALLDNVGGSINMLQQDGSPSHTILEAAKETGADLIIVGARGHSMLERILVGSVSEAVATHAPCSVLVVRPEGHGKQSKTAVGLSKLTLAYDGSDRSTVAAHMLNHYHWHDDTRLEILSVVPTVHYVGNEYAVEVDYDAHDQAIQKQAVLVSQELRDRISDVHVTVKHSSHIGDAIVQHAADDQSDVIIMGDSGHTPLGKLLLGSTTKYVLRHASCSVWIARPSQKTA